jgi:RND family efflux transporter MFP subunit
MNFLYKYSLLTVSILLCQLTFTNKTNAASNIDEHEGTQSLSFSAQQMRLANITTSTITAKAMTEQLYAPGEIKANGYTSYLVSPRVESVVVQRHAVLGDHVEKGQPMVTLFSENVAEAQAKYRIAYADWQRAKKVNKTVLSESQRLTTQTDYIAALSRLKAYGLTEQAINLLVQDNSSLLGEYTLQAERSGSVLTDDFQQGQRVNAGDAIMMLADESELWVEARLAANNQVPLKNGTEAQVFIDNKVYQGQIIQASHTIDAVTRTRVVRLKVNNIDHQLHPGLFVDVYFALPTQEPVVVVPESALLRGQDGDWLVYLEQHNQGELIDHDDEMSFIAKEVELGRTYRQFSVAQNQWQILREISGIALNSKIAVTGAFFIASQSAKSGFDAHNH